MDEDLCEAMAADLGVDEPQTVGQMCEQARHTQALSEDEVRCLAHAVSTAGGDSRRQRAWREWLFKLLRSWLDPTD